MKLSYIYAQFGPSPIIEPSNDTVLDCWFEPRDLLDFLYDLWVVKF